MSTPVTALVGSASLQQVLAGEHAAVYVDGVLAAQTSQSQDAELYAALTSAWLAHQRQRDDLVELLSRAGLSPVAAAAAYALPNGASSPGQVRRAALLVERRCTTLYAAAVAATTGTTRRWAVQGLGAVAVRQLAFQGSPETLPGSTG